MRNKIQKYLSGDHEGFSLVELIIVIAIMAILIGVVALAVLPYLEKSRESKDISMIDTVCSALAASVASTQASGEGSFIWGTAEGSITEHTGAKEKAVSKDMVSSVGNFGGGPVKWNCSALSKAGAKLYCLYKPSKNVVVAYASKTGSDVCLLERTTTNVKSDIVKAAELMIGTNASPSDDDCEKAALVSN